MQTDFKQYIAAVALMGRLGPVHQHAADKAVVSTFSNAFAAKLLDSGRSTFEVEGKDVAFPLFVAEAEEAYEELAEAYEDRAQAHEIQGTAEAFGR